MKTRFTLEKKMYIFVAAVALFAAFSVAALSYVISARQIDRFYKRITMDTAKNYVTLTDVEYLKQLKAAALSNEYQTLRDRAEETENEALVIDYLKEKGLWEKYDTEREKLRTYANNVSDVKYLYIVLWGDRDSTHNMYLLDADDVPVYETGYYEEREKEFLGVDASEEVAPAISNGEWGWLCSAYAPVYDDEGEWICTVGCDVSMDDVMRDRMAFLLSITVATLLMTAVIVVGAVTFIHKTVISPLDRLTNGMKGFAPEKGKRYDEAGVIEVDVKGNDEIRDIYEETRSMQIRIVDYINNIEQIRKEKEQAEDVVKNQKQEIGAISKKAYRDSLTDVGNKEAYTEKMAELREKIGRGETEFAIVMMDINGLKTVNDTYGHTAGDTYICGCCRLLCETFSHSPVYRIGGDEFAAVLTGGDYRERLAKLDEIRQRFAETENRADSDPWLRFSASVGMADFTPEDHDPETVFGRADQMMYAFKQAHKKSR